MRKKTNQMSCAISQVTRRFHHLHNQVPEWITQYNKVFYQKDNCKIIKLVEFNLVTVILPLPIQLIEV